MVRLSRCCNPLPGMDCGIHYQGRGISVHRSDCPNVLHPHGENRKELLKCLGMQKERGLQARSRQWPLMTRLYGYHDGITDTKTIINAVNARATKNGLAAVI